MKPFIAFLFLFCGSPLMAAKSYKLVDVDFVTDSSFGTFVFNGDTIGYIIGGDYMVRVEDSAVPGVIYYFSGRVSVTPRNSIPTLTQIRNAVKSHAVDAGIVAQATSFFNQYVVPKIRVRDDGLIPAGGETFTIP